MDIVPIRREKLSAEQLLDFDTIWPRLLQDTYVPEGISPVRGWANPIGGLTSLINTSASPEEDLVDSLANTDLRLRKLGALLGLRPIQVFMWAVVSKPSAYQPKDFDLDCLARIIKGYKHQIRTKAETGQAEAATLVEMCDGDLEGVDDLSRTLVNLEHLGVRPVGDEIGYLNGNTTHVAEDNRYWISNPAVVWATHVYYKDPTNLEILYQKWEEILKSGKLKPPVMTSDIELA